MVDVRLARDEVTEVGGRLFDERLGHQSPHDVLVGLGQVQVGDVGGAVDLIVPAGVRAAPLVDHVPVFDDLAVAVGVEQVGRDPAALPVVEALGRLHEHEATVDDRADDVDVALGVALDERLEELDEALDAVTHAGGVLGVPVPGVRLDGLAGVAVADALQVQAPGVVEPGPRRRRHLDVPSIAMVSMSIMALKSWVAGASMNDAIDASASNVESQRRLIVHVPSGRPWCAACPG